MPKPTTKNRQDLRSRFVRSAIPSEADFADLIAASLNQAEDGLFKLPDESLALVRKQPNQPVLRFFADPDAKDAVWQVQLGTGESPSFGLAAADGKLALVVDGATGNVGIGTATPIRPLTITGYLPAGKDRPSRLTSKGAAAIIGICPQLDFIDIDHKDWSISVDAGRLHFIREPWEAMDLVLDGGGCVGIGTAKPGNKLTIQGDFNGYRDPETGMQFGGLLALKGSAPTLDFIDTNAGVGQGQGDWAIHVNAGKMHFIREPWEHQDLVLDGKGNVGIGTTTPGNKLTIQSTHNSSKDPDSGISYGGTLALKSNAPQIDFIDTDHNDWSIHVNNNKMYFIRQPWVVNDLVLDGEGRVGIGTDFPKGKLHVVTASDSEGIIFEFPGRGRWVFQIDGNLVQYNSKNEKIWAARDLARVGSGKLSLKSWKGDYLHRPDGGAAVTTYGAGYVGSEWSIESVNPQQSPYW